MDCDAAARSLERFLSALYYFYGKPRRVYQPYEEQICCEECGEPAYPPFKDDPLILTLSRSDYEALKIGLDPQLWHLGYHIVITGEAK